MTSADIPALLTRLDEGYDMVVGARQAGSQASLAVASPTASTTDSRAHMTGHKIEDLTSGFRAVRAEKFREFLYLLPNGFSYPTTSTMAFFRAGYSVAYHPIHTAKRVGKSHIRLLHDGVRFLLIIFKIGTLYSPLKLFAPVSVALFFLGTSWYLYTFLALSRFTNMSALLISAGIVIFMMGLISEQITSLMYKDAESTTDRNTPRKRKPATSNLHDSRNSKCKSQRLERASMPFSSENEEYGQAPPKIPPHNKQESL